MEKIDATPHALCGARTRRGIPCQNWEMANGRCRMHGGKSTGPKTPEGRERIRQANWKHGFRSAQARQEHREMRELLRSAKELSAAIEEGVRKGSITLDELKLMIEQKDDIQSKLCSIPKRFKYLSFRDRLLLAKYYRSELKRSLEFFEQISRQNRNTQPSDSSATETTGGSEYPKTVTIRFCKVTQKFIIEEK